MTAFLQVVAFPLAGFGFYLIASGRLGRRTRR